MFEDLNFDEEESEETKTKANNDFTATQLINFNNKQVKDSKISVVDQKVVKQDYNSQAYDGCFEFGDSDPDVDSNEGYGNNKKAA